MSAAELSTHSQGITEKVSILGEILRIYAQTRRRLRSGTLESTLAFLRALPPRSIAHDCDRVRLGLRLGRATVRTLTPLPTDGRCLMRSLVLVGLLSRRGIAVELVLAVHPGERLASHAWVELDGQPLLEPGAAPLERLIEL